MRSKEADLAINQLKEDVNIIIYGNKIFEDRTTCKKDDLKTVLSYIEQLEKMTPTPENEVPVEYQTVVFVDKRDAVMKSEIRDKIKELEEQDELYKGYKGLEFSRTGVINLQIKLLKSIIGE